jgi:Flp pilus assembly protein CpaB
MDPQVRRRLFIFVGIFIVIVAVGVVLLLGSGGDGDSDADTAQQPTRVAQEATDAPDEAEPTEVVATAIPTQEITQIVVAVQNISRGSEIPPDAVRLQPWPREAEPFNAFKDPEEIIGRIARTDIYVEQPILTSMVVDSLTDLAAVGSDAAAIIPPGRVAISLPMDVLTSVSYAIQPGDRVDIIVSLLFVDLDEDFQARLPNNVNIVSVIETEGSVTFGIGADVTGQIDSVTLSDPFTGNVFNVPVIVSPSEIQRPRLVTQRTIQDAIVVYTGLFPRDGRLFEEVASPTPIAPTADPNAPSAANAQGGQAPPAPTALPPRPSVVTIAVTPQQAVMITWMVEAGIPLTFTLRSASDRSGLLTDPVTLGYIIDEYNIVVPRREEYSVEPAIRSIRQTFLGDTISITDDGGTGG